jgi:uncharacterized protein YeaO (DUF488 family)
MDVYFRAHWLTIASGTRITENRGGVCRTRSIVTTVRLKRAYEPASPEDGTRVLVDRLWPRGIRKSDAAIDYWARELAPSTELRKWFGHDPRRWQEFRRRYGVEISRHAEELGHLHDLARRGTVTLVFGARDELHNDAVVLREVLLSRD